MPKEILYIGMDESNHGETKPRIGEIVVATFSYDFSFWDYKKNLGRKDFFKIEEAVIRGVEYYYTTLPHELASLNYSNLPLVAPFFVKSFLDLKRRNSRVKLGLDGQLSKEDELSLTNIFAEQNIETDIFNFTKRNRIHVGPELIYLAHLIANQSINKSMIEIAQDKHYMPFDLF
jgi:hypothetical protein